VYYDGDSSESPLQLPEPNSTQLPVNQSPTPTGNSAYGPAVALNPLPPALAAPPDMKSLLRALKRRWLVATTLGLLAATLTSATVWYVMPKKYVAANLMTFNSTQLIKTGVGEEKDGPSPFKRETLLALAKTRLVLQAVVTQPHVAQLASIRAQLDPVSWLGSQIDVTVISPELISLTMTGTNPRELEQIVDAVALAYEKQIGLTEQSVRKSQVDKLDKMIEKLQFFVEQKKEKYRELVRSIGAADSGQRILKGQFDQMLVDTLQKLRVEQEIKLGRLEMTLKQAKERKGSPRISALEIDKALKEEPEMISLETRLEKARKDLKGLELVVKDQKNSMLQTRRGEIMKLEAQRVETKRKLLPAVKQKLKD
jgi:polysaccharide biosynthesis transport protein